MSPICALAVAPGRTLSINVYLRAPEGDGSGGEAAGDWRHILPAVSVSEGAGNVQTNILEAVQAPATSGHHRTLDLQSCGPHRGQPCHGKIWINIL